MKVTMVHHYSRNAAIHISSNIGECVMFSFLRRVGRTVFVASGIATISIVGTSPLSAQTAAATPTLTVGQMAPDFTVTTVTANGVDAKPFTLSDHRGETVVLAFFPKARTSGCTMQMEAYRDQYAKLFAGGKNVTLIGVSIDPDTALVAWAKEDHFPFKFATDMDRKVGMAYGANSGTGFHKRHLYVIDPAGKIVYGATPFYQMSADAYSELGAAVKQASAGH